MCQAWPGSPPHLRGQSPSWCPPTPSLLFPAAQAHRPGEASWVPVPMGLGWKPGSAIYLPACALIRLVFSPLRLRCLIYKGRLAIMGLASSRCGEDEVRGDMRNAQTRVSRIALARHTTATSFSRLGFRGPLWRVEEFPGPWPQHPHSVLWGMRPWSWSQGTPSPHPGSTVSLCVTSDPFFPL